MPESGHAAEPAHADSDATGRKADAAGREADATGSDADAAGGGVADSAAPAATDTGAAERLRSAPYVRVVAHADGDGLAAAGLLAGALDDAGVPFRVRLVRTDAAARAAGGPDDDAVHVAVGVPAPGDGIVIEADDRPASVRAYDVAATVGDDPSPVLALAGVAAAGEPATAAKVPHAAAEERGLVERRPGVAVATADPADGLAHSTLVDCDWSGDAEAADAALSALAAPDDGEAVASLVALAATGDGAPPRATAAVERALRPLATPDGPVATVGGYADVLAALSRRRPGAGVALALGDDRAGSVLDAWREHARAVHAALSSAAVERDGDVAVAHVGSAPVWSTARLLRDFRTAAPVAAAAGERGVAVAGTADVGVAEAVRAAADATGADVATVGRRGYARTGDGESEDFVAALREAV